MTNPDPNAATPPPDPLAAVLAKLEPARPAFDRDRLMFSAGRESLTWVLRCWQAAAAAALLVAGQFAYLYFTRPVETVVIDRPVVVPQPLR